MAGEVLSRWERVCYRSEMHIVQAVFKYAKEPRALFECIGEDLASSNQEVREISVWALVSAMPKLTGISYEWEIRQPGWSRQGGKRPTHSDIGPWIFVKLSAS